MRPLGFVFILVALGALVLAGTTVLAERDAITGWLIVAAIFCVIGLICIAAGGPRKVEVVQSAILPPQSVKRDDSKICPSCAEEVKKEAKICRYCNHAFPVLPAALPAQPPKTIADQNQYFFQIAGGVHQGPVGPDEIGRLIQNKKLGPDDQIRIPQQGWHKVSDINFS